MVFARGDAVCHQFARYFGAVITCSGLWHMKHHREVLAQEADRNCILLWVTRITQIVLE